MTRAGSSRIALAAFATWLLVSGAWWSLAFAPLPVPAEWLASARSVCFGSLSNGLPDTWGWAGLIVSPLSMLGFLLAAWGREVRAQLIGLSRHGAGRLVLALFAALPLVLMIWVGQRVAFARELDSLSSFAHFDEDLPDSYPKTAREAPHLDLIDQNGENLAVADLAGRPTIVTFAFAHCQTVCPQIVETVRLAARQSRQLDPALVIVTIDPWRDTPSSLPSLFASWQLDEFESRAYLLSGEVPDVIEVLEDWNLPTTRNQKTGDVSHPALVYVLDSNGLIAFTFTNPPAPWLVTALKRALDPDLTEPPSAEMERDGADRAVG